MRAVFLIVVGGLFVIYLLVMEAIDMAGRYEYLENHAPKLVKWAEKKSWHRVLLLVAVLMLGANIYELEREYTGVPEAPKMILVPPPAPILPDYRKAKVKYVFSQTCDRTLSTEQTERLFKQLKTLKTNMEPKNVHATIIAVGGDREASKLTLQLLRIFEDAGWNPYPTQPIPDDLLEHIKRNSFIGITIWSEDPRGVATFLASSLTDVGLQAGGMPESMTPKNVKGIIVFVGYKQFP